MRIPLEFIVLLCNSKKTAEKFVWSETKISQNFVKLKFPEIIKIKK
jgi:hypothetical protein